MIELDLPEILGNGGVISFLLAYFLLQKELLTHNSLKYLLLNLLGSLLLMYSLLFHWNLPAFLLEAAWALISIYGIYKYHIAKRNT